jgi:hypothetical protein
LKKRLAGVLGTLALATTAWTAATATSGAQADVLIDPAAGAQPVPTPGATPRPTARLGVLSAPDRPTQAPERPVPEVAPRAEIKATPKPKPKPKPEAAAARSVPSVGDARAYARRKIGSTQFGCLDKLWTKESGWNPRASNPSSGAYGIPQALPGSKMGSVASDWRVNPVTQVRWGLGYITDRYGTACTAWQHSKAHNWY